MKALLPVFRYLRANHTCATRWILPFKITRQSSREVSLSIVIPKRRLALEDVAARCLGAEKLWKLNSSVGNSQFAIDKLWSRNARKVEWLLDWDANCYSWLQLLFLISSVIPDFKYDRWAKHKRQIQSLNFLKQDCSGMSFPLYAFQEFHIGFVGC